jgi:hypothetical protein
MDELDRLKGSPILLDTGCRVGSHVFTWAGNGEHSRPRWDLRCHCGLTLFSSELEKK